MARQDKMKSMPHFKRNFQRTARVSGNQFSTPNSAFVQTSRTQNRFMTSAATIHKPQNNTTAQKEFKITKKRPLTTKNGAPSEPQNFVETAGDTEVDEAFSAVELAENV